MRSFKVGDIVVGNTDNCYGITGRGSVCKVINVYTYGKIRVKVIELNGHYAKLLDALGENILGARFDVYSKYFDLKKPLLTENE